MVRLEVKFDDAGAMALLTRLRGRLEARRELHNAMAEGLKEHVRDHLLDLNSSRSTRTGFYGKAARSVEASADGEAGWVRVPHRGTALRFYGGRVVPVEEKNLALPTANVPVRGGERMRPGEMDNLAFIPNRKGGGTTGYLVEGERFTPARGPNKGRERLRPKPGGMLMYVLRGWTDHEADPTVLPDAGEMTAAARSAGEAYLAAMLAGEGGGA